MATRKTKTSGEATSRTKTPSRRQRTKAPLSNGSPNLYPSPDQIRRRAYEIFLARGGSHGNDLEDWLAAERELSASPVPRST